MIFKIPIILNQFFIILCYFLVIIKYVHKLINIKSYNKRIQITVDIKNSK